MDRRDFTKGVVAAGLGGASAASCRARSGPESPAVSFKVTRLPKNPIIRPDMDARMAEESKQYGYININGPSLIRVPEWVPEPLGKYYLYFAHHKGEYIRLAYADDPAGPWQTYEPGALQLENSLYPTEPAGPGSAVSALKSVWTTYPPRAAWSLTVLGLKVRLAVKEREAEGTKGSDETRPHIASPDVIVDEEHHEIRMYYHGMLEDGNQMSRAAVSKDGINFKAGPELIASPYLRMFKYRDYYYGISMPGLLNRSKDGLSDFEMRSKPLFGVDMRHSALLIKGSILYVFWSRVGDAPERILCSIVDMSPSNWNRWRASAEMDVIRPEYPWEGSDLPLKPSIRGEITGPANQLRDPAVFEDKGRTYLLYSCAGEHSIGIAELEILE